MAATTVGNLQEYTVSGLSGAIKRALEEGFGYVRVRGELGRVTRPASGHMYLDLKDDKSVLSGVMWKGAVGKLKIAPEQGMEVVASGRVSTFAGQSRYQIIIDSLEPAGVGALMALLEERKKKLAAEGLFDEARKRPLPFLPETIGVVTSPSGAVIRDILHRLRDRFPRRVLVWPTLVQGAGAEKTIAAAIDGFNALAPGGDPPRPDVLIVARGGGSLEDLWCFNEEVLVRAAAASEIPLISAVGHETDTTLIDFAADRRAPTPTAAAEIAVPVRSELLAETLNKARRLVSAEARVMDAAAGALRAAARGLGRPDDLTGAAAQRLDGLANRLGAGLRRALSVRETAFARAAGRYGPATLRATLAARRDKLAALRLPAARLARETALADAALVRAGDRLARVAVADARRRGDRLAALGAQLRSLSHQSALERGFAFVRGPDGRLIRRAADASAGDAVTLVFADGERGAVVGDAPRGTHGPGRAAPRKAKGKPSQGSLFERDG